MGAGGPYHCIDRAKSEGLTYDVERERATKIANISYHIGGYEVGENDK